MAKAAGNGYSLHRRQVRLSSTLRISEGFDKGDRHLDPCRAQRIRWLPWITRIANRHPEMDRTDDEDADTITLCFRKEYTVVLKPSQRGHSVRAAYSVR